jgi:hypothetical protein
MTLVGLKVAEKSSIKKSGVPRMFAFTNCVRYVSTLLGLIIRLLSRPLGAIASDPNLSSFLDIKPKRAPSRFCSSLVTLLLFTPALNLKVRYTPLTVSDLRILG